jgi:cytochrome c-type biogenesis protein
MGDITLGLAFVAGLLSFVSPCVLPLVPAYVGYMSSRLTHSVSMQLAVESAGAAPPSSELATRFQLGIHGVAFVLGFTVVFVAFGLMTTAFVSIVGSTVVVLTDIISRAGGIIIIFFGLHFMGVIPSALSWLRQREAIIGRPWFSLAMGLVLALMAFWALVNPLLGLAGAAIILLAMVFTGAFSQPLVFWTGLIDRLNNLLYADTRQNMAASGRDGLAGSFIMGVVFSAGWTPCIGPLLGTILTLAAATGDVAQAGLLLGAYSLGLGIPFLITALLLNSAQGVLRRLQRHMRAIELVSGGLLVFVGVLVATGQLQILSQNLGNQFADFSVRFEECGVGFFEGDVRLDQVGPCVGGSLVPVALGQGSSQSLTASQPEIQFLFHLDAPTSVDVNLTRVEDMSQSPQVAILDAGAQVVATAESLTPIDDDTLAALANVALEAGSYTIAVRLDGIGEADDFGFRFRVDRANPEEAAVDAAQLPAVGSITGLAASLPVTGLERGNQAPDFAVTTVDGEAVRLASFRGSPLILNFWGTWCGPCRQEMPDFQSVYADSGGAIGILALALRDTEDAVAEFRDEYGLTFDLALDVDNRVANQYQVIGQPQSYLIDADGIIVDMVTGIVTEEQLLSFAATANG